MSKFLLTEMTPGYWSCGAEMAAGQSPLRTIICLRDEEMQRGEGLKI